MATTSPDNLFSPDAPSPYNLTVDLAAMQTSVQNALNTRPTNYRVGTDVQRLTLSGASLFEGLWFYATDTDRLWFYTGAAWRRATRFATWSYTRNAAPDGSLISDGTLAAVPGETTDSSFTSGISGSSMTLAPGVYTVSFTISGSNAFAGRSFMEFEVGGRIERNGINSGEDKTTLSGLVMTATSSTLTFRVYKAAGGMNLSGFIQILKVE